AQTPPAAPPSGRRLVATVSSPTCQGSNGHSSRSRGPSRIGHAVVSMPEGITRCLVTSESFLLAATCVLPISNYPLSFGNAGRLIECRIGADVILAHSHLILAALKANVPNARLASGIRTRKVAPVLSMSR